MTFRTEAGHFWITFENGYTLSCFNGFGSHTENHFAFDKWNKIIKNKDIFENYWESNLIEIAILYDGEFVTQNIIESDDSVKTVDLNELIKIINILKEE